MTIENVELLHNACLVGEFGLPEIKAVNIVPEKIISFNYAQSYPFEDRKNVFVHFFIDDYQFERVWNKPERYLELLKQFAGVFAPDFSIYINMPKSTQIYNAYRNNLLAHYYQQNGISVIACPMWADENSYWWIFDGQPENGTVAITTVGVSSEYFIKGFEEMCRRLTPNKILVYGKILPGMEKFKNKIIQFESNVDNLRKLGK